MPENDKPILEIKQLRTYFYMQKGVVKAVDGVNLALRANERLGIVGESGSGKTVTALSVLRLVQSPPGRTVSGEILLNNRDLLKFGDDEMRRVRSSQIAMIFQDPLVSLNPVLTIKHQMSEALREKFGKMEKSEMKTRIIELLEGVKIPNAEERLNKYPHQLSGGMRQRVMIAMATSREPKILIADEPTTSLDVITQAQVLKLLRDMVEKKGSSLFLVSHDMGVIAETCDKVAVMYAGRVMEYGNLRTVFKEPLNPYTQALLNAIPRIDVDIVKLEVIPGKVPNLISPPPGCRFHPRCKYAREYCKIELPELQEAEKGHFVACHFWEGA